MSFDRRITPHRPDLADERLRGLVEAERFAAGTAMRVVAPSAPLRRHPSPDALLDTEALMGEVVTVYDEHEGFAWGQLAADGYVGYLPAAALGPPGTEPTHRVGALRSFLFPGPNLKLPPTGFLSFGARVAVVDRQGAYARIDTGDFLYAPHLEGLDAVAADFVAVAERFLETPYYWGGKTSLGIDCSGLLQTALAAVGIPAPRDSDLQQAELGAPVDRSGLRRGDLVFWKGHVGIMVDGTRFVHANGFHMTTLIEPLAEAEARILASGAGPITALKRIG
jgi:cell wall-associated NlpC family hydrolase